MLFPESLKAGDTVAIISPASVVKEEYIDGAVRYLHDHGLNPVVMPHAKGPTYGSYAAPLDARVADLREALGNPKIRAIFCARGGYGCIHLLPHLKRSDLINDPKWLIGFSDVSALHAFWQYCGVASIHGPMAKQMTEGGDLDPFCGAMMRELENGGKFDISKPLHPYDRPGKGRGILRGGNLAVLNSLASTPYDILKVAEGDEVILFLEDIGEKIYEVERMISRLFMSGTIYNIKGLIFGQFTDYGPDRNFSTMEDMLDSLIRRSGLRDIPVAFDFPIGHGKENYPLTEGAIVEFETEGFVRVRY